MGTAKYLLVSTVEATVPGSSVVNLLCLLVPTGSSKDPCCWMFSLLNVPEFSAEKVKTSFFHAILLLLYNIAPEI